MKKKLILNYLANILFALCLLTIPGCGSEKSPPLAEQGVLDLSNRDFDHNGVVNLNGQWEFYWN
jgi:hypothetical protein